MEAHICQLRLQRSSGSPFRSFDRMSGFNKPIVFIKSSQLHCLFKCKHSNQGLSVSEPITVFPNPTACGYYQHGKGPFQHILRPVCISLRCRHTCAPGTSTRYRRIALARCASTLFHSAIACVGCSAPSNTMGVSLASSHGQPGTRRRGAKW